MATGMGDNFLEIVFHHREKETPSMAIFNYDCEICMKQTAVVGYKRYPVIFKPSNEKVLVCEVCLSFIKDAGEFSSFKVV
jgi:hypothetical protein